jgi:AcrR family transcriptional regulator
MKMSNERRRYRSVVRDEAASENRARIITAAIKLLGAKDAPATGLEAIAKSAGVTRLTVYNQFGSRSALLEEVFDELARRGGLVRIPEAMATTDPLVALSRLIEIFCDFWQSDPAVDRLSRAASTDDELAVALAARHERRRKALSVLVRRLGKARRLVPEDAQALTDTLFALTSPDFYRLLSSNRRKKLAACALVRRLCEAAVDEFLAQDAARRNEALTPGATEE